MRVLYLVGLTYVGFAVASVYAVQPPVAAGNHAPHLAPEEAWFTVIKPSCNSVEISQALKRNPPLSGWRGAGYAAACQALAGRIDDARLSLLRLPEATRPNAAAILFNIGHPIADLGDDVAAGPIMDLVVESWPENYQAIYHAGMSDYALGRPDRAKPKLLRFRKMYTPNDFFGNNADKALDRIERGLGPDTEKPGAHN